MRHVPFSVGDIQPFKFAVSTSNINRISLKAHAEETIARNRHCRSINLVSDTKKADFSTSSTSKEHVSSNMGEIVVSCESCIW
jgi:hypothetical protein